MTQRRQKIHFGHVEVISRLMTKALYNRQKMSTTVYQNEVCMLFK
jgi:hypothetical protein